MADSLFVALMLPVFFENLLGVALRDAVIPYLQMAKLRGIAVLRHCVRRFQARAWIGGFAVTSVVAFGASIWLKVLVPGWGPERVDEFVWVFQLASVLIAVQTILYFQAAVFNASGSFVLPMMRTVLLNLGAIVALAISASVDSVGWVVAGMLLGQLLLLGIMQNKMSAVSEINISTRAPEVQTMPSISGYFLSLLVVAAAQQACFVLERMLATYMPDGSIAQLSYAFRIGTIPLTLFSFSVLTIIYPAFTSIWLEQKKDDFVRLLQQGSTMTLVFLVPAAVVVTACASNVIALLLQRGAFGAAQTAATAPLLAIYGIGLPAMGLTLFAGRVLVAIHEGRLFAMITVVCSLVIVIVDLVVYKTHGAFGLALGYVLGNWLQALMSLIMVTRRIKSYKPYASLIRWGIAALLAYWILLIVPYANNWIELFLTCIGTFILCLAIVAGLGERRLLETHFWRLMSPRHPQGE